MTFLEMQTATRAAVYAAGLSRFTVIVEAVEHHPGRIAIQWSVFVARDAPKEPLYHSARSPVDVLNWLKKRLATGPDGNDLHPDLTAIGDIPAGH